MKKILIIEDNEDVVNVYHQILTEEGYEVIQTSFGKIALGMIQTQQPDLILLDIMLPGGMNGFDILEDLKRTGKLPKIPVIVLTNLNTQAETAKELGAIAYLIKADTDPEEILTLVNKTLQ